jgi:hypothetical protein
MAEQPDQERAAEVKKQLEALAGREIDVSGEQLLKLWFPAGASSYGEGSVTWKSVFIAGKRCDPATILDASGTSFTGSNGTRVFLLSEFVCFAQVNILAEPINVVATPRASTPSFLTMTHQLVKADGATNYQDDVSISVFTWDANGAAAPNVAFAWRCRVVSVPVIG